MKDQREKDKTKDMTGVTVEAGEGDGTNVVTPEAKCCERVDPEGKQPIFNDARLTDNGEATPEVLAMIEAVAGYGAVMDACIEEAARLIPKKLEEDQPVQQSRFEARIKVALALYNRATGITQKAEVEKYLDRLIEWYEAKDRPPGESGAPDGVPAPSVPFPVFTRHETPTDRLANLLLDFLESRVGVIFGEVKEGSEANGKAE